MSKIIDKINANDANEAPFVSFEYFPPRTDDGVANLYNRLERMKTQDPLYIDFTWGAGGTTSELTLELSTQAKARYGLESNMHLTCTNMPSEKVDIALDGAKAAGIMNIVALRGDPPAGKEWTASDGGFSCALDLIKHIRKRPDAAEWGISCAGYPEGHPNRIKPTADLGRPLSEAEKGRAIVLEGVEYVCSDEDYQIELTYLKEKVDAGAEFIITQMFFDVDLYLKFVNDCQQFGINAPILPGLMIIQAYPGFRKMVKFCKSRVPADLEAKMESLKDDADGVKAFGIEHCAGICRRLISEGKGKCKGLHFYTLNLEKSVMGIMDALGLSKPIPQELLQKAQ